MVPVLARELREGSPSSRLALEAGRALLAAGYHQQVPVRPGFLNLFALVEGQRRALAFANGVVEVRGTRERWPVEEALRRLEADPAAWSPGALLRPLVQDALLPTAAYVGGPAEIAYHAQIAPSYAHFGIPRPALLPRASLTLVEPQQARALEAERLSLGDLVGDPEALVSRWAREAYPDVETAFVRTREAIEREMGAVEEALGATTRRCARPPPRPAGAHSTRSRDSTRRPCAPSRSATRGARTASGGPATRFFPGARSRSAGSASWAPSAGTACRSSPTSEGLLDPFARGHQVVRL